MTGIYVSHRFFPVGQGLFSAGSVQCVSPNPKKPELCYRWVYDCGTSSGKRLITNAIADLKNDCRDEKIDLLTLSHFHNDHISGVVDLLKAIGAKTVMLPWAPLWHRLLIGFEQGLRADDPEMLFFVDPVQYLVQAAGDGFEQVLFVMPSDGGGPPFPTELTAAPEPPEDLDDPDKPSGPGEPVSYGHLDLSYDHGASRVRMLRPGQAIPAFGVWEFVPYNDPDTEPFDPTRFSAKVDSFREPLLKGTDDERKAALKNLRVLYDAAIGRASMNDVSLVLYGGAVGPWTGQSICNCECFYHRLVGVCGCWKEQEM